MPHRNPQPFRWFLLAFLTTLIGLPTFGQGADVEPNDTCFGAQELGAVNLPFVVEGELDPEPDVDYFSLTMEPGIRVRIDHEGTATGQGTLGDPLLGVFDGACNLLGFDDESGLGGNARLVLTVPDDGRLILAATSFPDFSFQGGGPGSYQLTLGELAIIDSISGRVVDGITGDPLSGYDWPFAHVYLFECGDAACDALASVGSQSPDADGTFRFTSLPSGDPLPAGIYKIHATAQGYGFDEIAPFEVAEGASFDTGDLAMTPWSLIGTVVGRLVDAVTGQPLPGTATPFAKATLERCYDFGCVWAADATVDDHGRFQVFGPHRLLPPGRYSVRASAQQYEPALSPEFDIGEREDIDIGDLALEPVPVRIVDSTACADLPTEGGVCRFSVDVLNASRGRFRGAAWGDIRAATEFPFLVTHHFQVGKAGTVNPMPQRFNLAPRQSARFEFAFDVPPTVENGALICASVNLGKEPSPHLDLVASRFLFCISKRDGTLSVLGEKEGHRKLRELKGDSRP